MGTFNRLWSGRPQHWPAPVVATTPHVCLRPALIVDHVKPVGTALSPSPAAPQQNASPFTVTPQVCAHPALMTAHVKPVGTLVWPSLLEPKQYASPSDVMPQVWYRPALSVVHV